MKIKFKSSIRKEIEEAIKSNQKVVDIVSTTQTNYRGWDKVTTTNEIIDIALMLYQYKQKGVKVVLHPSLNYLLWKIVGSYIPFTPVINTFGRCGVNRLATKAKLFALRSVLMKRETEQIHIPAFSWDDFQIYESMVDGDLPYKEVNVKVWRYKSPYYKPVILFKFKEMVNRGNIKPLCEVAPQMSYQYVGKLFPTSKFKGSQLREFLNNHQDYERDHNLDLLFDIPQEGLNSKEQYDQYVSYCLNNIQDMLNYVYLDTHLDILDELSPELELKVRPIMAERLEQGYAIDSQDTFYEDSFIEASYDDSLDESDE